MNDPVIGLLKSLGCVSDDNGDRALTLAMAPACAAGEKAMSAAVSTVAILRSIHSCAQEYSVVNMYTGHWCQMESLLIVVSAKRCVGYNSHCVSMFDLVVVSRQARTTPAFQRGSSIVLLCYRGCCTGKGRYTQSRGQHHGLYLCPWAETSTVQSLCSCPVIPRGVGLMPTAKTTTSAYAAAAAATAVMRTAVPHVTHLARCLRRSVPRTAPRLRTLSTPVSSFRTR